MWPQVKNTRSHQRQGEVGGGREVLPTPRGQAPGVWKLLIYAPPVMIICYSSHTYPQRLRAAYSY